MAGPQPNPPDAPKKKKKAPQANNASPSAQTSPSTTASPSAKASPSTKAGPSKKGRKKKAGRTWGRFFLVWTVRFGVLGAFAFLVGCVLVATGGFAAAGAYEYFVVQNPGPGFTEDNVRSIIAQESPVYYRDGTTRVGVFFEDEHREYLAWDDLPRDWVVSIVAAEDAGFWTHHGISPWGIAKALGSDLLHGEVVAGGSTLTQQTAKNLFYRPDRSFKSKVSELGNAMKLEAHFDKGQILTFYANQFHVNGNGRGLGIAARYFFDKEATDLTLVEAAFLAGSVKGPSNYDPFVGDDDKRQHAKERAHDRTRYVLRRITEVDAADLAGPYLKVEDVQKLQADAQALLDKDFELPFKKGTFRYDDNIVLDEVGKRLKEAPFDKVLKDAGIDDPSTAGLVVVTTLDEQAQREAIYGLWHDLTEVGTMLEGKGAKDFVLKTEPPHDDPDRPTVRHEFRIARVVKVSGQNGAHTLDLDLGGHPCVADRDAVTRAALYAYRGVRKDRYAKVSSTWIDAFVADIPVDSVVFVSIRDVPKEGPAICDLEVRPELQGAAVVTEDGQIRAMVGGNDNRNFNRATAPRQLGSTWKPILYHTAIDAGWSPADILDNQASVFNYGAVFYYPSSDEAPVPTRTMAWAGVHSENIASVWLLYHLADRLDADGLAALATKTGLARGAVESQADYAARLKKDGFVPDPRRLDEVRYLDARREVAASALAHPEDALALESTVYGWGFEAEKTRVTKAGGPDRDWKLAALDRTWTSLQTKRQTCADEYQRLSDGVVRGVVPDVPDLAVKIDGGVGAVACGTVDGKAFPEGYVPVDEAVVRELMPVHEDAVADAASPADGGRDPDPRDDRGDDRGHGKKRGGRGGRDEPAHPAQRPPMKGQLTGSWSSDAPTWSADVPTYGSAGTSSGGGGSLAPLDDVLVDGRIHLSTIAAVQAAMDARQGGSSDVWDPKNLYGFQDFRVLMSIRAVVGTAKAYGVHSDVKEVLPVVLGASEISIEEATSVYDGLVDGKATPTTLIVELRDVDGNVLYKADGQPAPVTSPEDGAMTADILRNVVLYGTARRAAGAVRSRGAAVPVGGKTGTTNDYRNSAFLGYVPRADGDGYTLDGAWAIGVYVGYDDNRSMDVGRIEVAGAVGAVPAWMSIASGIVDDGLLGAPSSKGSGTWALKAPDDLQAVAVDADSGAVGSGAATVLVRK